MNKEIINKLKELKPILKERYGIEEFAVFGSVARGEDLENSDIDIVILKIKKKSFSLRLKAIKFLESTFNKKIDLGYFDSMKTFVKRVIQKDMVYV